METTEATEWTPAEDFDTGLTADDWKEILEDDDFIKNHPAGSITLWLYYKCDTPLSYTGLTKKYGLKHGFSKGGMTQFNYELARYSKFKEKIHPFTDEKGKMVYLYLPFAWKKENGKEGTSLFKLRKEVCEGFDKLSEERRQMFAEMYQRRKKEYEMNPKPKIWVISAGDNGKEWANFISEPAKMAIGWNNLGDLTGKTVKEIEQKFSESYDDNNHKGLSSIKKFVTAKEGDFIFARAGQKLLGCGRVNGKYKYDSGAEYRHTFPVEWIKTDLKSDLIKNYRGEVFTELNRKDLENQEIKEIMQENPNLGTKNDETVSEIVRWMKTLVNSRQIILTGAPGTGKSYAAREIANRLTGNKAENIDFVQFHPSMDYTDFVEGLRPIKDDKGQIGFERRDGIFKAFCKRALEKNQENFVFIIDEINRGDISKIFGELFFAIDPSYRGKKGKITTQYQNLVESDDLYADGFYIPENVYIIGTMNDIDRGVESMDFAIRRRFTWIEVNPDDTQSMLDSGIPEYAADAKERMGALNKVIFTNPSLGKAYQIGAAYFLRLNELNGNFDALWAYHLEPLLREYLRGDPRAEEFLDEMKKAYGAEAE